MYMSQDGLPSDSGGTCIRLRLIMFGTEQSPEQPSRTSQRDHFRVSFQAHLPGVMLALTGS